MLKLINGEYVEQEIEPVILSQEELAQQYHELVITLIREKYTVDDEFKFINIGINDRNNLEYIAYRNYVETCKNNAKITLNIN